MSDVDIATRGWIIRSTLGAGGRLAVSLSYDARDPYAVTMTLDVGSNARTWSFARTLLATGVRVEAGGGDVTVRPWVGPSEGWTAIDLTSHQGEATLLLKRSIVEKFLRDSFRRVPPGNESAYLDVDAAVARMRPEGWLS